MLNFDFDFAYLGVGIASREVVEDYLDYLEELKERLGSFKGMEMASRISLLLYFQISKQEADDGSGERKRVNQRKHR